MTGDLRPTPFKFGYYYDHDRDKADRRVVQSYDGERHMVLFGINGSGKSTRILIENLVSMRDRSFVVFDVKGELAAQTARTRRAFGDVKILNPYDLHDLGSDGFNPLALLDPDSDDFFDQCKLLTIAMIDMDGSNQFFPRTAQGWFCAGIMWEVIEARSARPHRAPSLLRARQICLEPDRWQTSADGRTQTLVAGVAINARRMVDSGDEQLAGLAARFASDSEARSLQDVLTTLATETEFLISKPISRDLQKGGWSFDQLKEHPTTVYVLMPPEQIEDKRKWMRLLVTCALIAHLKPGRVRSLFILDEFRVTVGRLKILSDFWALVRGYGVQFLPVCQSITQLQYLFDVEFENYMGQAGVVATLGAPGDPPTAEWMSRRSGNMTVWQQGWSEGEGEGGASGSRRNMGESRSQQARAFKLPEELMSLKDGTGYLWISGRGDRSYPFYAPNWWQRDELKALVDPNPFRGGGTGTTRRAAEAQRAPQRADNDSVVTLYPASGRQTPSRSAATPYPETEADLPAYLKTLSFASRFVIATLPRLPLPVQSFIRRVDPDLKGVGWFVRSLTPKPEPPKPRWRKVSEAVAGYVFLAVCVWGAYRWDIQHDYALRRAARVWVREHAPPLLAHMPAVPAPPVPQKPAAPKHNERGKGPLL